jgi:hypothetical protein
MSTETFASAPKNELKLLVAVPVPSRPSSSNTRTVPLGWSP